MGRREFTSENKAATVNYEYPKLKLKKGEKARIIAGFEAPYMEYVHTLRKPQIVNGEPVMTTEKRKDGSEYETYKLDFVSKPICLGREEVLEEKGLDPDRCPACKLAQESTEYTSVPQRRYAMHVAKYRVKAGSDAKVATPFSVDIQVWAFTDKVFNKLVDLKDDFGGDLRAHDIILGPCTNEDFQQFDITPTVQRGEWLSDNERKIHVATAFKENQIPDLSIACGSVKQESWIRQDCDTIRDEWAKVKGATANDTTSLDTDLDALLDNAAGETDAEGWATSTGDDDIDALLGGAIGESDSDETAEDPTDIDALLGGASSDEPEPEPAPAAKKAPAKKPAPAAKEEAPAEPEADNFEDLLAGLPE